MHRRAFLQQTGVLLATLGLSGTGWAWACDRYARTLAQPTSRKLALLIGINQYTPLSVGQGGALLSPLNGCLTDVELQRELLHHRFGFQTADILTLTDGDATRDTIESAFLAHLVEQAQPGDVVVFHFSGYGGQARTSLAQGLENCIIPADSLLPSDEIPLSNDILESTLWLMARSLSTSRVAVVLDTGFGTVDYPTQSNLHLRSRLDPELPLVTVAEKALQSQLMRMRTLKTETASAHWERLAGLCFNAGSSVNGAKAFEVQWNGFCAGALTYALTQQLWQATPASIQYFDLQQVAATVERMTSSAQQPQAQGRLTQSPLFEAAPDALAAQMGGADGVILSVEDNGQDGVVWLAGLPVQVLEHYLVNSQLLLLRAPEQSSDQPVTAQALSPTALPKLLVRSRDGLTAKVRLMATRDPALQRLQVGQLVQESVRMLPRRLGLAIALDANLARIERVDATSALSSVPYVSAVVGADQPADYLLGRVQDILPNPTALAQRSVATIASTALSEGSLPQQGYGLRAPGGQLLLSTLGEKGEAIKVATRRLVPQFQALLAAKYLRLLTNGPSSRLGLSATLEVLASEHPRQLVQSTLRASWPTPASPNSEHWSSDATSLITLNVPMQGQLHLQVQNYSDRPLYFLLLELDNQSGGITCYPGVTTTANRTASQPSEYVRVEAGQAQLFPTSSDMGAGWAVSGPVGLRELYLLGSRSPFAQTLTSLRAANLLARDASSAGLALPNPLSVIQAVLHDLHLASAKPAMDEGDPEPSNLSETNELFALNVEAWAAFNWTYRVVA
jgi:hypothetical protein